MDTSQTLVPDNQANIAGEQILLEIIEGPERENMLRATSIPNRAGHQINTFTVKFKNIPIQIGVSFDGCRYDRYSNEHIIVNGEIVDLQIPENTNKTVCAMLQRAKDFCSQVQLRYNYCTCDSGKIYLQQQITA